MGRFYIDDEPVPQTITEWAELLDTGTIKEKNEMIQKDHGISTGRIVQDMMKKTGKTARDIEKACGWTAGKLSYIKNHDDALFSTLVMIAKACGYKIHFVKEDVEH